MFHDLSHLILDWILIHGPLILFFFLSLGIVALPLPDDSILFFAGVLIASGELTMETTVLAAVAGSLCGITVSYLLGRNLGPRFIKRYGHRLHLTDERMERTSHWFSRIGKWTLLVCYFVPVLRHVAGFVAGSSKLKAKQFMLFAYIGAFLWVSSYLCLGFCARKIPDWLTL